MAHLAYRGAPHRPRLCVVARRPRRKVERHVLSEIRGRGEQASRGTESPLRERRFLQVSSVRPQAIAHRAMAGGHLGEFESGRIHVQLCQDLRSHVLLVRHTRCLGHDAAQQAEGVVGVFVARAGRRGKRYPEAQPFGQVGVAGAQLLVAPGIVLREAGAVAEQLPDPERRAVARRQLHAREFGKPLRHQVFERQLALIPQLQNRQRRETLRHRGDAKRRAGRDRSVGGPVPHARRFDMREPVVDHHAPHHPGNLPLGRVPAEDPVDFRKRRFQFPDPLRIGEPRWRVSVARGGDGSRKEAAQGNESHVNQNPTHSVFRWRRHSSQALLPAWVVGHRLSTYANIGMCYMY